MLLDNLAEILSYNRLDEIIITLSLKKYERLEEIVNTCEKSGVHTKFIPDYNNIIPTKPYTEDLLGIPPEKEIEFKIALILEIVPIPQTSYRMAPA